jgi:hypothetical protein
MFDALHWVELGALVSGKAEVDVHKGDFAWAFLLFGDVVGDLRNSVFLESLLDEVNSRHGCSSSEDNVLYP